MADYNNASPQPKNPAMYDVLIVDDEKAPVRAEKEAIHKSGRSDYTTFEATEREAGKFILSMVEDIWFQELKSAKKYYTLITSGQMLANPQAMYGGLHALDVLTIKNEMQRYHLNREGTPEYIKEIKDAQAKAKRAKNSITNVTLDIVTANATLSTEQFL